MKYDEISDFKEFWKPNGFGEYWLLLHGHVDISQNLLIYAPQKKLSHTHLKCQVNVTFSCLSELSIEWG